MHSVSPFERDTKQLSRVLRLQMKEFKGGVMTGIDGLRQVFQLV
jgi:hypothetical protein